MRSTGQTGASRVVIAKNHDISLTRALLLALKLERAIKLRREFHRTKRISNNNKIHKLEKNNILCQTKNNLIEFRQNNAQLIV